MWCFAYEMLRMLDANVDCLNSLNWLSVGSHSDMPPGHQVYRLIDVEHDGTAVGNTAPQQSVVTQAGCRSEA